MATKRRNERFRAYHFKAKRDPDLARLAKIPSSEFEQRSCLRKRRYRSDHEAKKAIEVSQPVTTATLSAYQCQFCDGFHMTSRPQYRRAANDETGDRANVG